MLQRFTTWDHHKRTHLFRALILMYANTHIWAHLLLLWYLHKYKMLPSCVMVSHCHVAYYLGLEKKSVTFRLFPYHCLHSLFQNKCPSNLVWLHYLWCSCSWLAVRPEHTYKLLIQRVRLVSQFWLAGERHWLPYNLGIAQRCPLLDITSMTWNHSYTMSFLQLTSWLPSARFWVPTSNHKLTPRKLLHPLGSGCVIQYQHGIQEQASETRRAGSLFFISGSLQRQFCT